YTPENNFTNLVISSDKLTDGEYSLWLGDTRLKVAKQEGNMGMGGRMPMGERMEGMPEPPEGERPPMENMPNVERPPMGEMPIPTERPKMPDGQERPEGMPEIPDGKTPTKEQFEQRNKERLNLEYKDTFTIEKGANYFMVQVGE
ncbi:MAG: hypothetical protein IJ304_05000, partial [Clostridia bacterium]|nr:hypothetical protein [Clostridia bacterium]